MKPRGFDGAVAAALEAEARRLLSLARTFRVRDGARRRASLVLPLVSCGYPKSVVERWATR